MKNISSAKFVEVKHSGSSSTCVLFFDSFGYGKSTPIAVCVDGGWNDKKVSWVQQNPETWEWEGVFNPPMNAEECQFIELAEKTVVDIKKEVENYVKNLRPGHELMELSRLCSLNFVSLP